MAEHDVAPELKQILGALIFGATRPLTAREMRRCLQEVGEHDESIARVFAEVRPGDIDAALAELEQDLAQGRWGIVLGQVAGGYRLQSDPRCGMWLKHLLAVGKPKRLSQPSLETLAVIAFRQPVVKSQIEAVRGVAVDHVLRQLLEMQLIRIAGRSDLPGRPFLYATTHLFLEHFGLKSMGELSEMGPGVLARREARAAARNGDGEPPEQAQEGETGEADALAPEAESENDGS